MDKGHIPYLYRQAIETAQAAGVALKIKDQPVGAQRLSVHPAVFFVLFAAAVLIVAQQRMADRSELRADLMRASCPAGIRTASGHCSHRSPDNG